MAHGIVPWSVGRALLNIPTPMHCQSSGVGSMIARYSLEGDTMIEVVKQLLRQQKRKDQFVLAEFASLLFAEADPAPVSTFAPDGLARYASETFEFVAAEPPKSPKIRVRRIAMPARQGGKPIETSVVEIHNADMPFLVDSVMGEIQEREIDVRLVLHPIFKASRGASGRLDGLDHGDVHWSDGRQESFISVFVEPLDEARANSLAAALGEILGEVRSAVVDWSAMRARLERALQNYESMPRLAGRSQSDFVEAVAFLRWLCEGQFTFLGMRDYELAAGAGSNELAPVAGQGLGLLRDPCVEVLRRGKELVSFTPEIKKFFFSPAPLIITKANVRSRVHRRVHMDYIGIKTYGPRGELQGELRLVGLFTSQAYTQSVRDIPFLRQKAKAVAELSGFPPESHSAKSIVNLLETFPRDELFQIPVDVLLKWAVGILELELRPRPRVFARRDEFDRFVSLLVFLPRDRFSTAVREKIAAELARAFNGHMSAFTPTFTEGRLVRVQFIIGRHEGSTPDVSDDELEAKVVRILTTWDDRLATALGGAVAPERLGQLLSSYRGAFSAGYSENSTPERAVEDILRIERLSEESPVAIDFYREPSEPAERLRVAVYRFDAPIPLSKRVPVLENMGFSVINERTYQVSPVIGAGRRAVWLHDMVLETSDGSPFDVASHDARLEGTFLAVWRGTVDDDAYNRLVIACKADAREVAAFRAYGAYLRQIRSPFGQRYLVDTLLRHAGLASDLFALFRVRFDPAAVREATQRNERAQALATRIETALKEVENADEDRILRHFLNLITVTKRTNFYLKDADGAPRPTIAFKFNSKHVDGLPAPKPFAEIFVHSPRVEGIHLRNAEIARGGIRWSDRAQDFRTEVLGLAKAQQVKNAVIVPEGAKGGFVPKQLPREGGRDAVQKEGVATYELFISSLLEITDNLVDGKVVHPKGVVLHDEGDPYLVVAADKGTATFSDTANALAAKYGFWLDDAFASGGSAGYDHKKMAITARGGWECVKRHFREMDIDIQKQPFTVAGVGDMSGDVFGNAMLLSPAIKLVAAFDHRHIFIDPSPDPIASLAERKRLFELTRSSWQDYAKPVISKGGGVFSRSLKAVPLSPEARALLDLTTAEATPTEVIRAILKARVDLIWFGGIGTYVKASTEAQADAGDRANDANRINAGELRAKVIGEGANLGMTQRGRIEYADAGGRLNTDFIDNSAGVNCSDVEVNIKIGLLPVLASGSLDKSARNDLLAAMTADVAAKVLRNNYLQSLAISLASRQGALEVGYQQRLMRELESKGLLDREIEFLPKDAELSLRSKVGKALSRPEIAVLLSYAKIALFKELVRSRVPDDPYLKGLLLEYFPKAMRARYEKDLASHRLSREIIATGLTNTVINRGGPTFVARLADETGFTAPTIVYAYMAVAAVHGLDGLWDRIDRLDGAVKGEVQLGLYQKVQDLIVRETVWFLSHVDASKGLADVIASYRPGVETVRTKLAELIAPGTRAKLEAGIAKLTVGGVPADLARDVAALDLIADATDITSVATRSGRTVEEVARIYWQAGEHFRIGELRAQAEALKVTDHFDRLAINATLAALWAAQSAITLEAITAANGAAPSFEAWRAAQGGRLERAKRSLDEILGVDALTVSRLAVAAAHVRDLVQH
ncbi:MAG: NAD-glutamate dehydrogenase [Hyphomicrobiaceae bacterium]|nr:MAG: NAD-glutamate dehydrogenase [Hyphomicrobiaceae bacterium]